jgi:phage-related protein
LFISPPRKNIFTNRIAENYVSHSCGQNVTAFYMEIAVTVIDTVGMILSCIADVAGCYSKDD